MVDIAQMSQLWNGSSWTEIADLSTPRKFFPGVGTSTSALAIGGDGPITAKTESWNGSSWTEVGDLNLARASSGASGTGNTSALCFGGYISPASTKKDETESWNGTSWTEISDLGTARSNGGAAGNSGTAAFYASGTTPGGSPTAVAEQFTVPEANSTITVS